MDKIRVAITGGIGSGKSLALQYISDLGYPIFSCDEIYKEVIGSKEYIDQIASICPDAVINGKIDRKKLAEYMFSNKELRNQINNIAHPLIMENLYVQMDKSASDLLFAEVPLLFEGNFEGKFDKVIYIYRDKDTRLENVKLRDGISKTEIEQRMAAQFDPDCEAGKLRLQNSNIYVIKNDGTPELLNEKISDFITLVKQ